MTNTKIPFVTKEAQCRCQFYSTEFIQEWKEFSSKRDKNTKIITKDAKFVAIHVHTINRTTIRKIQKSNSRVLFSSNNPLPRTKISRNTRLEKFGLTVQLMQTPPPRNFPRMSMDILPSATSWSYLHEVACPLQLHFSQWKPFAAVPGFHGIWLYMGQHFSHLSPHVWRSHSHSWCYEIYNTTSYNATLLIFFEMNMWNTRFFYLLLGITTRWFSIESWVNYVVLLHFFFLFFWEYKITMEQNEWCTRWNIGERIEIITKLYSSSRWIGRKV